jgi:hypothetical protein
METLPLPKAASRASCYDLDAASQPQLRLWRWLAAVYPHWLRWPEHKAMLLRMLRRITAEEAHE